MVSAHRFDLGLPVVRSFRLVEYNLYGLCLCVCMYLVQGSLPRIVYFMLTRASFTNEDNRRANRFTMLGRRFVFTRYGVDTFNLAVQISSARNMSVQLPRLHTW
ncbi:hypothetical protein CC78DRAFT_100965 [Lojkania enalia]|uniref:Uncharacterized protein n=1 Tax=Lojkania enalia TaxID=147567 RepID=A0A9P4N293_9PLEO|nr:hypothetical protein CC78DRAFT_100965 [Didymosphaeria enalia]